MPPLRRSNHGAWVFVGALLTSLSLGAKADQGWEGASLTLNWDNDANRGSDRHYTQGARIQYLSADLSTQNCFHAFSDLLPTWGYRLEGVKAGVEMGQEIYTPENLDASEPLPDDRPYAGWLYLSSILQRRGQATKSSWGMETWRVDVGVVGPPSLAEAAQRVWHGRDPQGWDNQLKTEVGFNLRYERSHLFRIRRMSNMA